MGIVIELRMSDSTEAIVNWDIFAYTIPGSRGTPLGKCANFKDFWRAGWGGPDDLLPLEEALTQVTAIQFKFQGKHGSISPLEIFEVAIGLKD